LVVAAADGRVEAGISKVGAVARIEPVFEPENEFEPGVKFSVAVFDCSRWMMPVRKPVTSWNVSLRSETA